MYFTKNLSLSSGVVKIVHAIHGGGGRRVAASEVAGSKPDDDDQVSVSDG